MLPKIGVGWILIGFSIIKNWIEAADFFWRCRVDQSVKKREISKRAKWSVGISRWHENAGEKGMKNLSLDTTLLGKRPAFFAIFAKPSDHGSTHPNGRFTDRGLDFHFV